MALVGLEIKKKNPQISCWQPTQEKCIVARCKFLVTSLYDVNDAAHSMAQSIRFDCLKILRTEVGMNLEVNWLCLCDLAFYFTLLF